MNAVVEIPNLDAMETKELLQFWVKHRLGINAHLLFPDSDSANLLADGQAAHKLSEYALTKVAAVNCRRRGDIAQALRWEALCDTIYADLPARARW
jgi:hypothetical protein